MRLYALRTVDHSLTTEYEQLLGQILEEKKAKLVDEVLSDMRYVELEIEHYQNGLRLFRSKSVPKVGRWGKPESEEHAAPAAP
jgi:hypothetical protein